MKTLVISPTSFVSIEIDTLHPNELNLTSMDERNFKKLKEHLDKSNGNYQQPILVRPHNWSYEIVDGFHRWKAMKELDFDDIHCKVEELSDKDAIVKAIQMNKFRGDFDTVKLAQVIRELKEDYDMTNFNIRDELGYEPEEIFALESFLDFNAEEFVKVKEEQIEEVEETPNVEEHAPMLLELTEEEAELIKTFVDLTWLSSEQAIFAAIAMYSEERAK